MDTLYELNTQRPTRLSYSVQINNCVCPEVRRGVHTVAKTYLEDFEEIVLSTSLPTDAEIYVDNSMTFQK